MNIFITTNFHKYTHDPTQFHIRVDYHKNSSMETGLTNIEDIVEFFNSEAFKLMLEDDEGGK